MHSPRVSLWVVHANHIRRVNLNELPDLRQVGSHRTYVASVVTVHNNHEQQHHIYQLSTDHSNYYIT